MIIQKTSLFDNAAFKLSPDLSWEHHQTDIGMYTIIENFYEDLDAVNIELDKLPLSTAWGEEGNNETYFDGRRSWVQTMQGTELPYVESLGQVIANILGCDVQRLYLEALREIIINCFTFTNQFDNNRMGYSAHVDSGYGGNGVALIIFLNRYYKDGEGFNLYNMEKGFSYYANQMEDPIKENLTVNQFIQAKPNRGIVFSTNWLHGQHTPTDQFLNEMRYTQVMFFQTA